MATRKKTTARRAAPPPGEGTTPAAAGDERTAAIYALMGQAEALYKRKHYRQAMAVCAELAALDPTNAMPEQMADGCRRELRNRRAIAIGIILAVGLAAVAIVAVYSRLTQLRIRPLPGTLHLRERQAQLFQFQSSLGYHKTLEYRWSLLDPDGQPVPATEDGTLTQHDTTPWECTYLPPYSLVLGAAGGPPVTRRIVASGVNALGRETVHAEWTIEVADVPLGPRVVALRPRNDAPLSIVAGQGSCAFFVEASDGDGGPNLTYEWSAGKQVAQKGPEPTWTYRPPADALPAGKTGREVSYEPPLTVACRIANRAGDAPPQSVEWPIRLVRSNALPQLIAFEPELSELVRIKEGETRTVTVKAYDPDEAETLTYAWELDGAAVSRRPTCTLKFPHHTTDSEKKLALRLTVTDSCGAAITRSWQVVVVDAPPPTSPPSY